MLDALRRGANSWVLKPLLILLVLAFIVWGVADVFTGVRQGSLASVGNSEISVEEYQSTYGSVLNNLARRFGRRPTSEEARLRGIDRMVLDDLVSKAAIDQQTRSLGLTLPQSAVAAAIEKDPALLGPDGRFERLAFENYLREIGYNERGYLNLRQREEVRQQLTQSLFQDMPVPASLAKLVNDWREETRTLQHFTVDAASQVKLEAPDDAKLKEVYEAQQRQFVTPELRHIAVLVLSAEEAKRTLEISEEELRKVYDGDVGLREVPERRRILQINYKDKAAAEAAVKAIAGGRSFVEAAKDAGATEQEIDLGLMTKAAIYDQAIAEAAFALAKDSVSAPVVGRFSTVLLRVTEIEPAKTRTFEEVRPEVREQLAARRVNEALRKLHDAVDDGRAAGKPLKEIAESLKLKLFDLPSVNALGQKPDGTPAYQGPDAAKIIKAAFEGKPGIEIEPIDLEEGGYAWIDVINVTEQRQRPFEDVKDDVRKVWERQETARLLSELAAKLIERADKGETMAALAKEVGGKLATSKPFKRFATDAGLPGAAVQRAFAMKLGARASVDTGEDGKRFVFRVVEIQKPEAPTKEQIDQISQQLRTEMQQDAVQAYVLALRDRFGVRINEALFKRTTGESSDQTR